MTIHFNTFAGLHKSLWALEEEAVWLKRRLRTMGPIEVFSRLSDLGRHCTLWVYPTAVKPRVLVLAAGTNASLRAPGLEYFNGLCPTLRHHLLVNADQWLHHWASFFGLRETFLGDTICWRRDYSSDITSPLRYSGLIKRHAVETVGDVRYVWELNRLQHLVLLALAATWTGRAAYTDEIERQLISWRTQNPFMKGINWKSPLEASIRLISWSFISFLLQGSNRFTNFCFKELRETIYQHQYFIRNFYSKNSSANNHLIGEMAGLYVGAVFWPWYRESASWQSFARQKLIQEIVRQVEDDGVSKERAIEYHLFILELFLLAGALGHAVGDRFPQHYWDRLARMRTFLAAISDRVGNLPMFGDGDSGQVVRLPESTAERGRVLARLDPSLKTRVNDLRLIFLLWGQTPRQLPIVPVQIAKQSLQAFPQGGYYVLSANRGSEDEMVVVFDTGPLGLPPLYAHGHSDALSFCLSYGGREFFVDPGTYCYHTEAPWRLYFRGTAAHNTVRVDEQDQSVSGGPFLWRHVASCRAEKSEDNDEFVEVRGSHDGYQRLQDPVTHTRNLRLVKRSRALLITDHLECRACHDIELVFHFGEQCQIRPSGSHSFEVVNGNKRLAIQLDSRLEPKLYRGSETPIFGWVSRRFRDKEPSFTLVSRAKLTGSRQFQTEITAL